VKPRPPITDRQALEWAWKQVREATDRWLHEVDRYEALATQAADPAARETLAALARAHMRCAYELKDLYFALRLLTEPDKPVPPRLQLIVNNDQLNKEA